VNRYHVAVIRGAFKITPQFDYVSDFDRNGRATVTVGSSGGLIDETGRFVANPIYDTISLVPDTTEYFYFKPAGTTAAKGVFDMGRIDKDGRILSTVRGARCRTE
jgi:hypothetical protein